MINKTLGIITATFVIAAWGVAANADVIAEYDFSDGYNATAEHANVTADTMVPGVEVAGSGFLIRTTTVNDNAPIIASGTHGDIDYISGTTAPAVTFDTGGIANSLAAAITNDHYLSFIITPDALTTVDPTLFSVKLGKDRQGVGPRAELLTSQGGGWAAGNSLGQRHHTVSSQTSTYTWDLSSLANITSATEFRLYFHDTASSGWHDMLADDVKLEGTVTLVPEPASLALVGLGGLLLVSRRR